MRIPTPVLGWLTAAGVLFSVGAAFHFGVKLLAPGIDAQFQNNPVFRPWDGWTSTYMTLHPFGFAVAFTAAYLFLSTRCEAVRGWRGGLGYGVGVFAVGSLPVYLLANAAVRVPSEVTVCWVAQSGCQYLAAGAALGWVMASRRVGNPPPARIQ